MSVVEHIKWVAFGKLFAQLITWGATLVVIRYLHPSDYGLFALAGIVIGFAHLIGEFGLAAALVQDKDLTQIKISAAQGLVVVFYFLLTVLCLCASPVLAWFYDVAELSTIISVLSVQFLILSLGAINLALLQRELKFRSIAITQMIANLSGALTTLVLAALLGLGVWSLVIGSLTVTVVQTVGYRCFSNISFHVSWRFSEARNYLKFGAVFSGQRVVWYINNQLDALVVGRTLGAEVLGFLAIAKEIGTLLIAKVLPIVNSVFFPLYSHMTNGKEKKDLLLRSVSNLYTVLLPACWGLAYLSEDVVFLVLGSEWGGVVNLLGVVALWSPITIVGYLYVPVLNASGLPHIALQNSVLAFLLHLFAIIVGGQWGVLGVCVALGFSNIASMLFNSVRFCCYSEMQMSELLQVLLSPFVSGMLMLAGLWWIRFGGTLELLDCRLVAYVFAGVVIYGLARWITGYKSACMFVSDIKSAF